MAAIPDTNALIKSSINSTNFFSKNMLIHSKIPKPAREVIPDAIISDIT